MKRVTAEIRWRPWQRAVFVGTTVGLAVQALVDFTTFFVFVNILLLLLYVIVVGLRVFAVLAGLSRRNTVRIPRDEASRIPSQDLPVYTILCPLYHEKEIAATLISSLKRLDYPENKLDVKLLIEEDDTETSHALEHCHLPGWMQPVVVPEGRIKTKPRACNQGLREARGDLVVIYDAEDRPEPDQLRKAVAAFRRAGPDVGCLQAKLNFFNRTDNLISRLFTIEYTTWFDLYLPGIHALRGPIPLGGTSNHFRREVLEKTGGWDAFNVTEDCDLGIRLAENRTETLILDSTTWEEATTHIGPWVRQRSRWMKGFWQTLLVHTHNPLHGLKILGIWKFLMMFFTVGGHVMTLLLNPVCWAFGIAWLIGGWPIYDPTLPWTMGFPICAIALLLFNFLFIFIHLLGCVRRRLFHLIPFTLLLPFYWVLVSIGAWKGFLQFFTQPFKWEKTPHGFNLNGQSPSPSASRRSILKHSFSILTIVLSLILILGLSLITPVLLDYPEEIERAAIDLNKPAASASKDIDDSWLDRTHLNIRLHVAGESAHNPACRMLVYLKVLDGKWYQFLTDRVSYENNTISERIPLDKGWKPVPAGRPWGPWCLRRVREAGVLLYSGREIHAVSINDLRPEGSHIRPGTLSATLMPTTEMIECCRLFEARFQVNRTYDNPFDPDQADFQGVFIGPDSSVTRVPAFYSQDYSRHRSNGKEILNPIHEPYWAVRFLPRSAGSYTWHIQGRDHHGNTFKTETRRLTAGPTDSLGLVTVNKGSRYFSRERSGFFYPLPINLCFPVEKHKRQIKHWDFPLPDADQGTFLIEKYMDMMADSGMNTARLWMCPWWCGLEWRRDYPGYHGLGVYSLTNAWRLDHLIHYAAKKGLLAEITLQNHGPFTTAYDSQWKENPYNKINGGPLRRSSDVITSPVARKLWKRRLRYIAARWGAFPNVFGWTMWIEVNVVNKNRRAVEDWHREMCAYLRALDCGNHPISTEFNDDYGFPGVWKLDTINYTQLASYNQGAGIIETIRTTANGLKYYPKPVLIEEYGGHAQGTSQEFIAHEIHDGLWAGWFLPISAAPMAWWWNFFFEKRLDRYHRVFSRFIAGERLDKTEWQLDKIRVRNAPLLSALTRTGPDRAYAWVYYRPICDMKIQAEYWKRGKALSQNYAQTRGAFNPFRPEENPLFVPTRTAEVTLNDSRFKPGTYRIEFWDTWTRGRFHHATVESPGKTLTIRLPEISKDIAIKAVRVE